MTLRSRLETLQLDVVRKLSSIVTFPEGLLPHTVFVEEEGEDERGCGTPVYNEYQLVNIKPDGSCTLRSPVTNEDDEERHLSEINIDWLLTVWGYYCDLAGVAEPKVATNENPLEQPLRQLMDVALLEITGFDQSHTFEVCEQALNTQQEKPKELYVFMYSVDRHERNISDGEIIKSWEESEGGDLDTERYTPDEFACKVNDEEFCDSLYWVRFIKM